MNKNRRTGLSRFFVPHPTYAWHVKAFALYALLAGVVLGGIIWLHQLQMIKSIGLEELAINPDALEAHTLKMLIFSVTLSGIAFSCFTLVVGAFFFHRICGPIYRLKNHMLDILNSQQQVQSLKLRKTDQLQDIVEIYNALLFKLEVLKDDHPPNS
jgi:sensor histidine kinase YesM